MEAIATVIQQQLGEIGVNLKIEGLDNTAFFTRFMGISFGTGQEATWELGTNGWDQERGDSLCLMYNFVAEKQKEMGFSDKAVELAVKVNTTASQEEAKKLAAELHDVTIEECWEYPLTYTNYVMVSQKNVKGLDGSVVIPEFADWLKISVE